MSMNNRRGDLSQEFPGGCMYIYTRKFHVEEGLSICTFANAFQA